MHIIHLWLSILPPPSHEVNNEKDLFYCKVLSTLYLIDYANIHPKSLRNSTFTCKIKNVTVLLKRPSQFCVLAPVSWSIYVDKWSKYVDFHLRLRVELRWGAVLLNAMQISLLLSDCNVVTGQKIHQVATESFEQHHSVNKSTRRTRPEEMPHTSSDTFAWCTSPASQLQLEEEA